VGIELGERKEVAGPSERGGGGHRQHGCGVVAQRRELAGRLHRRDGAEGECGRQERQQDHGEVIDALEHIGEIDVAQGLRDAEQQDHRRAEHRRHRRILRAADDGRGRRGDPPDFCG
jgi:hypothetical protein